MDDHMNNPMQDSGDSFFNDIRRLYKATKALALSTEQAVQSERYAGMGKMIIKNYNGLYQKALQLLPDDEYIKVGLELEPDADMSEEEQIGQVRFASNQMMIYLKDILREERTSSNNPDVEELKSLGRDLQEQIINMTKRTLKRALTNIDFGGWEEEDENGEGRKKRRIKVDLDINGKNYKYPADDEDASDDTPKKKRIKVEVIKDNDVDVDEDEEPTVL